MAICEDDVDVAILQSLIESGDEGIRPRNIAKNIFHCKLEQGDITDRILRMNIRLKAKIGKEVAEKRGERWVTTAFLRYLLGFSNKY